MNGFELKKRVNDLFTDFLNNFENDENKDQEKDFLKSILPFLGRTDINILTDKEIDDLKLDFYKNMEGLE